MDAKTDHGKTSRRKAVVVYRAGMVLQVVGAGTLAVLYPIDHPFYTIGIMLFELGALISGATLVVWTSWIKKIIVGAIVMGISVQIFGLYFAQADHALTAIFGGIGLVCMGTAGMAGKEAYCTAAREGWLLMFLYPVLVGMNLFGNIPPALNAAGFSLHFLLLLFLTGKKLNEPLRSSCSSAAFRTPEAG